MVGRPAFSGSAPPGRSTVSTSWSDCPLGLVAVLGLVCVWHAGPARAQEPPPPARGWNNETELSLALTAGNSAARTLGFGNTLRHGSESSRFQLRLNGIRSGTADDRYLLVEPGVRFPVDGSPDATSTRLVEPEREPDVENYLVSGRYDVEIGSRFFWNAGGSWDRNTDAGILSRYTAFAGVGNVWRDSETLRFATTYAASYTDRREAAPDPRKDARFGGARLGWEYRHQVGAATVVEHELTANVNLTDAADNSLNTVGALGVDLGSHLALRVSLQLLYENDPAPEDVAVIARARLVDPDGVAGSGDELFETVAAGGAAIRVGAGQVRKGRLDTIVRTALVIGF